MKLLVGLGNPGSAYAHHRHNVGFMALDRICAVHGFGPERRRFSGLVREGVIQGAKVAHKVLALKPETYMNLSGDAVVAALQFYKIALGDLIVLHDEIDLQPAKMKVKAGGGDAGNNGLRSITAALGPQYRRVRIGVGHPGHKDLVARYVLHDFSKEDRQWLEPLLDAIAASAPLLVDGDDAGFMNKVALLTRPPEPPKAPKSSAP